MATAKKSKTASRSAPAATPKKSAAPKPAAPKPAAPKPAAASSSKTSKAGSKTSKAGSKTSKAGSKTSKAGALGHKLARATAELKKEFARLQSSLHKLRGAGTESFDALYELVGEILASDPPLYLGGGYKTKEEFIAGELPGETLRSVQRNVLVARCFSPAEEARHGIAFLEEVALYAKELTGAEQPPPAIHLDKLTLSLPGKNGATARKKAAGATIEDVRQARRALRKGAKTKRDASPVEAALRAALGAHKALSTVTIRASQEHASFGNVPVVEIGTFGAALSKVKIAKA